MATSEDNLKDSEKKCKLRTASDVISRLLWDESLPKSHFTVGYLDRFKGVVEKPFVLLDWSDPATVDNYTLALPKHRIMYFKYRNTKVWDKTTRTDFVFGSGGCERSIYEVMAEIDENEDRFFHEVENLCSDDDRSETSDKEVHYDNEDRPNFFVCARITEEETLDNLSEVSAHIQYYDPTLKDCCMTRNEYHLTLATLKLNSPEEINDAFVALNDLKMHSVPVPTVELSCLGVFQYRVLYACVRESKELQELRNEILQVLEEWKLSIMDKFAFIPHVTLVKTSRPVARLRGSRYIDKGAYEKYLEHEFGKQTLDRLYLCEMAQGRREDGFYMCAAEIDLT